MKEVEFTTVWQELTAMGLQDWARELRGKTALQYSGAGHGDLPRWLAALEKLRQFPTAGFEVREGGLRLRGGDGIAAADLEEVLMALSPWRKGPFYFEGVFVDTEWRSDWKWERLRERLSPIAGRRILDVGCGNGYHLWRMLAEGARFALGIDPAMLFGCQFLAARHFAGDDLPIGVLPVGIEDVPADLEAFDTVFSMGVLYHRKSPVEHLEALRNSVKAGGEVVLETLVVEGDAQTVLLPKGRYAQMRNVWFLPSVGFLQALMERVGLKDIEVLDVTATTIEEQRATRWMTYQSLENFLDPTDPSRTIEGYPGPIRAVLRATK